MNKEKKKVDPVILLLDAIIVALVIVIIYFGYSLHFWFDFSKETASFQQTPEFMSYELSTNDYAGLIRGKYVNEMHGEDLTLYHALAEYIEAASHYKVYEAKGYTERANEQAEIMKSSRKEMQELSLFADKIDKNLGIK